MSKTKIQWTERVWNPVTGCTKISAGCKNCYAERMSHRLRGMGVKGYQDGFNKITCHFDRLSAPFKWKKPQLVFVNSMSDLFHDDVPDDFIFEVFAVMNKCSHHAFQILTKRPMRVLELNDKLLWTPNIWMGVSIESIEYSWRACVLSACSSKLKFISFEPLLGEIFGDTGFKINPIFKAYFVTVVIKCFNWIIVGGETGPGARPMDLNWADMIRRLCQEHDIPFFFKQAGGFNGGDRMLAGREYKEMPLIKPDPGSLL